MKIEIICSDDRYPVRPSPYGWARGWEFRHDVAIVYAPDRLAGGDMLFAISCYEILCAAHRDLFRHALVVHASDLPSRRGRFPHVWSVPERVTSSTVSFLTADDPVDSGLIVHQKRFEVEQSDLLENLNAELWASELCFMNWTLENVDTVLPREHKGEPTYCRHRITRPSSTCTVSDTA